MLWRFYLASPVVSKRTRCTPPTDRTDVLLLHIGTQRVDFRTHRVGWNCFFFYPAFDWTCYLSRCLNYILVSMASVFYFVAKDVVFSCSQPVDTRAKPCLLPPGIRVLGSLFTSLRDEVATRIQRWQFHGHALDAIDLDGFSPWLSDCRRPLVSIEATV